ncbi:alpha/beta hydrolase [Phanerochaete sordida]|uniref:Alpha/beta hydrolase n=1 Tax=Phanerochaete sordida TaxID=48140 RepID=A0A9P3GXN3_9APHY|nr:alpha/beta hydrolase [Phanerochaete sordida]
MQTSDLVTPDPELAALYAACPPPPERPAERPTAVVREGFEKIFMPFVHANQRPFLPPESAYIVQRHDVQSEGGTVPVRTYRPAVPSPDQTLPLVLWLHGGGWRVGNIEFDDLLMKIYCVEFGACMVSVGYRLAPEHPFPTGLNDCYAVLKWAVFNASNLGADPAKGLVLWGQSAGGNLAAVLTHRAASDPFFTHERRITGLSLQIPVLLHPNAVPLKYKDRLRSYVENEDAQGISAAQMRNCYDKYSGAPTYPEVSPFLRERLESLPPTYVQVCGKDPNRDEGIVYAERLREAGVPTRIEIYPGAIHGFHLQFPDTALAQKFEKDAREGIRWLLNQRTTK